MRKSSTSRGFRFLRVERFAEQNSALIFPLSCEIRFHAFRRGAMCVYILASPPARSRVDFIGIYVALFSCFFISLCLFLVAVEVCTSCARRQFAKSGG